MEALNGKNVFIRTVTCYYTGKLAGWTHGDDGTWLQLDDAAWIADTGRFADALATGELTEVEPYPGTVFVAVAAVVDMCEWAHKLPRKQR